MCISPPLLFFNILIEDVNNIEIPTKLKQGHLVNLSVNDSALEALTGREIIRLGNTFPDFNIVELNRTFFLSNTPAYKLIYTFTDPGSPPHPVYESMIVWAIKEGRVYNISYTAEKSAFLNYLPTIQDMIDSFAIVG